MQTPFYLIDHQQLQHNLQIVADIRRKSGAKCLLALKCFSAWKIFDWIKPYLDGTTSSSVYEVRLGHEQFGGETIAYSVAYADHEIDDVIQYADKIIFNSVSQLNRFETISRHKSRGLRVNPQVSFSDYLLADPCRPYSRLGENDFDAIKSALPHLTGFMFHIHCDNTKYKHFDEALDMIEEKFAPFLHQLEWVNLGGGVIFTDPDFPIALFCKRIKKMSETYGVQIYLEPGQAIFEQAGTLEVSVIDTLQHVKNIAVVDSSIQAHMIDLLIYDSPAEVQPNIGEHRWLICGNSCLAGDIFGEFNFTKSLEIGDRLSFHNAIAYSIVNRNWFNGLRMPSIAIKMQNGEIKQTNTFNYSDFLHSQS